MRPLAPYALERRSQGCFVRGICRHGEGGPARRMTFDDRWMVNHRDFQLQIETGIDQSAANSAATAGHNNSPAWRRLELHRLFSKVPRQKR